MAFEDITPETKPARATFPYLTSLIVTGVFLLIVLFLWIFQSPIQTWWKNLGNKEANIGVVTLPPVYVAQPVVTATPGTTPTPTTPPVYTYIYTPTPAAVAHSKGSNLPQTGPSVLVDYIGVITLLASTYLSIRHWNLLAVRKQARNIDIL